MMKTLLLLLLGTVITQAKEKTWAYDVHACDGPYLQGRCLDFNGKVPYLDSYDFDNTIESVRVKGIWIFYDLPEYNTYGASYVHYTWGLAQEETFQDGFRNKASSLRFAGSQITMNEDGYNLYEGNLFTKRELYETNDIPDLMALHMEVTSIIIIGKSSWTFCEDVYYSGHCVCLRTDHYDENHYERLDVGFLENISYKGLSRVRSVKKGCY